MAPTDGSTYAIVNTGYRLNPLSFTTTVLGHARSSRYQQQRWQQQLSTNLRCARLLLRLCVRFFSKITFVVGTRSVYSVNVTRVVKSKRISVCRRSNVILYSVREFVIFRKDIS